MHAAGRKGNRRNEDSERQQDMMGGRISEKEFRDSRPFMRQAGKIRTVREAGLLLKVRICAVSYTHLDVYKRQLETWVNEEGGR